MEFVEQCINHNQQHTQLKPMLLYESVRGGNESPSGEKPEHRILAEVRSLARQKVDRSQSRFADIWKQPEQDGTNNLRSVGRGKLSR
jgi:hypothetical protein